MKTLAYLLITLTLFTFGMSLSACTPPPKPCLFTANEPVTVYRLPDSTSDEFGTIFAEEAYEALAYTADGWVGFDPGVAQAGNIGLAHHRWVLLNATVSPSCLTDVNLVTLADVQADLAASGQ